jgi:hypothetical protein
MISALPLFLQASLGHRSVWDWFTCEAQVDTANYKWDIDQGLIPVHNDAVANTKLHKWEQLDDLDNDDDDDVHSQFIKLFVVNRKNSDEANTTVTLPTKLTMTDTQTRTQTLSTKKKHIAIDSRGSQTESYEYGYRI